ncbi:MAG: hypothetical protein ABGX05_06240 [Pirellulaceae bacterium]
MPHPNDLCCWLTLGLVLAATVHETAAQESPVSGDIVIRAAAGNSEIAITTTNRLAGAIHSLTWNGQEFINSSDHGRQLQSAANFDAGSTIRNETYNPTEAGSRRDGAGPRSSSKLLSMAHGKHWLQSTSQMAFWLAPGDRSGNHLAKNTTIRSRHLLTKRVEIGYRQMPHVIRYQVTFHVPAGEQHQVAVFEALTGYMPASFSRFWKFNPRSSQLEPLSDGPGEQLAPVVLATPDGRFAMGCFTPEKRRPHLESTGYGRFRFPAARVVKWNCVFRLKNRGAAIASGNHSFEILVLVGDLETVRTGLKKLSNTLSAGNP